MLTEKIRAHRGVNKSSGLPPQAREMLIAATAAAKQQMHIPDRNSWPNCERDSGPVHISVVIRDLLTSYGLAAQLRSVGRG